MQTTRGLCVRCKGGDGVDTRSGSVNETTAVGWTGWDVEGPWSS